MGYTSRTIENVTWYTLDCPCGGVIEISNCPHNMVGPDWLMKYEHITDDETVYLGEWSYYPEQLNDPVVDVAYLVVAKICDSLFYGDKERTCTDPFGWGNVAGVLMTLREDND